MVVQHNLKAMNSNRMLGITQKTVAGSTEKLSSGYKINRAADNAAGLSSVLEWIKTFSRPPCLFDKSEVSESVIIPYFLPALDLF